MSRQQQPLRLFDLQAAQVSLEGWIIQGAAVGSGQTAETTASHLEGDSTPPACNQHPFPEKTTQHMSSSCLKFG